MNQTLRKLVAFVILSQSIISCKQSKEEPKQIIAEVLDKEVITTGEKGVALPYFDRTGQCLIDPSKLFDQKICQRAYVYFDTDGDKTTAEYVIKISSVHSDPQTRSIYRNLNKGDKVDLIALRDNAFKVYLHPICNPKIITKNPTIQNNTTARENSQHARAE